MCERTASGSRLNQSARYKHGLILCTLNHVKDGILEMQEVVSELESEKGAEDEEVGRRKEKIAQVLLTLGREELLEKYLENQG